MKDEPVSKPTPLPHETLGAIAKAHGHVPTKGLIDMLFAAYRLGLHAAQAAGIGE